MEITIKTKLFLDSADLDLQGNIVLSMPIERCMDDAMCDAQRDLREAIHRVVESGAILGCTDLGAGEIYDDLIEVMIEQAVLKSLTL